jgi:iron-sulfur cluster assembly accessory protein
VGRNPNYSEGTVDTKDADTVTAQPTAVTVSPAATSKVADLLEQEGNPEFFLRVAVQPGGCSGLRYSLYFDDRQLEGDIEMAFDRGVRVRVDRMSAPYLKGATLDWLDGLQQSGFTINNPNATGTCACGDSFH